MSPRRLVGLLSTWLFIAAAVGWFALLRPPALGGGTHYVMVTGDSMEPTMQDGDFVIARSQPEYEVGDIVVYSVPEGEVGAGSLIIHRVIGGSADEGYITQGDNSDITLPDIWRPTPEDISGEVWVHIPAVGKVIPYLRSPIVLGLLAGLFAFWFVMGMGKKNEDESHPAAAQRGDEAAGSPSEGSDASTEAHELTSTRSGR